VVEICGGKKSDGWFMHAITAETWLLKLKFRVAKNTFKRDELVAGLALKPLNDMPDLPVYGNEPRAKCKNLVGPFQEVELRIHSLDEIDVPAFWKFLEDAVAGFQKHAVRARQKPEDVMPWTVLGQKWHLSRKGFPPGKNIDWNLDVLEHLCELLAETAPGAQFLWNNRQAVRVCVPGQKHAWANLYTKRAANLELVLVGPKGQFALGRIAELGRERRFEGHRADCDAIKLWFNTMEEVTSGELASFLREHFEKGAEVGVSGQWAVDSGR
jgi:excinuclease ABC subunit A